MLDKYRAAIAAHLRKYLPPSVTVYELGNSLDDAELQRLCLAAPGVAWSSWARTAWSSRDAAPM